MNEELLDTGSASSIGTQHSPINLPNAGGILTMGILSIVFTGIIGVILAIIALSLSGNVERMYRRNPEKFREGSYKNMRAGKVCSIIGLSLAGLLILIMIVANI